VFGPVFRWSTAYNTRVESVGRASPPGLISEIASLNIAEECWVSIALKMSDDELSSYWPCGPCTECGKSIQPNTAYRCPFDLCGNWVCYACDAHSASHKCLLCKCGGCYGTFCWRHFDPIHRSLDAQRSWFDTRCLKCSTETTLPRSAETTPPCSTETVILRSVE